MNNAIPTQPARRRQRAKTSLLSRGEPMLWMTGGAMVLGLLMIVGLLGLIFYEGFSTFIPRPVSTVTTIDGERHLGEITRTEFYKPPIDFIDRLTAETERLQANATPDDEAAQRRAANAVTRLEQAQASLEEHDGFLPRSLVRTANYELTGTHYTWIADHEMAGTEQQDWALAVERLNHGNFYGLLRGFAVDGEQTIAKPATAWARYQEILPEVLDRRAKVDHLEAEAIGAENDRINRAELQVREAYIELESYTRKPTVETTHWLLAGAVAAVLAACGLASLVALKRHQERDYTANTFRWFAIAGLTLAMLILLVPLFSSADRTLTPKVRAAQERAHEVFETFTSTSTTGAVQDLSFTPMDAGNATCNELQAAFAQELEAYKKVQAEASARIKEYSTEARELDKENERYALLLRTANDHDVTLPLGHIARAIASNQLSFADRAGVYLTRWGEFLTADPRNANQEGGVFPAIFGTVIMTLLMTLIAVPFGVLAALYLREYAKAGPIVSAIRIAINNLAGVPSIVFGVFGLGFFCYTLGGWIDTGASSLGSGISLAQWLSALSSLGLSVALAVTGLVVRKHVGHTGGLPGGILASTVLIALAVVDVITTSLVSPWISGTFLVIGLLLVGNIYLNKKDVSTNTDRPMYRAINLLIALMWIKALVLVVTFVGYNPFFDGFYKAHSPNPYYGKGGIFWAACTLALLTLPVVIVATEEAMAAVPGSMREGSYACGASKWQTIKRIVLPRSMPGILTGTILAMARGAGEVAPLMLVGAVKLAPELPADIGNWHGNFASVPLGPLHPERSFMHLGFHIYDLGFQSPNAEAAKPMVFTTTLLLITIVVTLNLTAIWLRGRISKKFQGGHF